jgi:hypothetical protein
LEQPCTHWHSGPAHCSSSKATGSSSRKCSCVIMKTIQTNSTSYSRAMPALRGAVTGGAGLLLPCVPAAIQRRSIARSMRKRSTIYHGSVMNPRRHSAAALWRTAAAAGELAQPSGIEQWPGSVPVVSDSADDTSLEDPPGFSELGVDPLLAVRSQSMRKQANSVTCLHAHCCCQPLPSALPTCTNAPRQCCRAASPNPASIHRHQSRRQLFLCCCMVAMQQCSATPALARHGAAQRNRMARHAQMYHQ